MNPLLLLGAAAAALMLSKGRSAPSFASRVTGKSGHAWLVTLVGVADGVKTCDVIAPAGSWGPHLDMPVLRYTQSGSDTDSRELVSTYPNAPAAIVAAAKSDFL